MTDLNITPREKEVIWWLCAGKTANDIGSIIGCSKNTVESHKHHMMIKLGVPNVVALVAAAFRRGIVQ